MENQKTSVRVARDEKVLTADDAEILHFYLDNSVFVSFFSPEAKRGCAMQIADGSLGPAHLGARLLEVEKFLGHPAAKAEVKVVGPRALARKLKDLLVSKGIQPASVADKEATRMEVFFYSQLGRVRAAVSEAHSSASSPAPALGRKTRVLIVDDSATVRKLLTKVLATDPDVEVVGAAELPSQVDGMIQTLKPDVITLDIHMPEMDGVTLLKTLIVPKYGIPTVMITAISKDEGPVVFEALESGAVDYIQKPSMEVLSTTAPQIVEKIKTAARAKVQKGGPAAAPGKVSGGQINQGLLVAIGSSTGGTEALKEVLTRLPENIPPILIVQHIPAVFSLAFANRLNTLCPFEVKEAADGDEVRPGRVLIAPGGFQMRLVKKGAQLKVVVEDTPPVNRHKPSVDVLFDSVAEVIKKDAVGVILTGMGADGAKGMLKMKQAGARTIAQDEASCVVFGMPKEAIKLGAADHITPLLKIPQVLVDCLSKAKVA